MYSIVNKNIDSLITNFNFESSILFGNQNKKYKICSTDITNILIYDKKLGHAIALKQVEKRYKKLLNVLTELLVDDSADGTSLMEALNQIEKFRQMIKNKYRRFLKQQELKEMSSKLVILQQQAYKGINDIDYNKNIERTRSSCK